MIKKSFLWLHKWLGLAVGLVVFIVSITGCIYVFYDDLKIIAYPERFIIKEQKPVEMQAKPLSELLVIANKALPEGQEVSRVDVYPAKDRTWVFRAMEQDKKKYWYSDYVVYHKRVFVDPYLGKVQFVEDSKFEFFQIVLQLHRYLLLGSKLGGTIVGISTIIFIVLCISGLVLWWPKKWKKKMVKKAVWVDYSVKWKRLVYDLHNVFGFQSLIFALIIAFFGLTFTFPGFKKSVTKFLNGNEKLAESKTEKQLKSTLKLNSQDLLSDALSTAIKINPTADMVSVRLKESDEDQDVQVRLEKNKTSAYKWYYFDQKTGELKKMKSSDSLKLGDYIMTKNYDLHTGGIAGYPTKILAFAVSLICASLPVTGTIVWWNKRPKKKKKHHKKPDVI